jgi:hypothetical protein
MHARGQARRDTVGRDGLRDNAVRFDQRTSADVIDDRALAPDGRVVVDAERTEVVALGEHRAIEIAKAVVTVDDEAALADGHPLAEIDRRPTLDDDVIGEGGALGDGDPRPG